MVLRRLEMLASAAWQMVTVTVTRVAPLLRLRLRLRLRLHLHLRLRLRHQIQTTTGITTIMMDMGIHRTSLIEGNVVPKEGRLSMRDARRNALVRQNGALERLVENIRSLTSFSSNLYRSSKAKPCCTIKRDLLI
jgi:hypothetical protein